VGARRTVWFAGCAFAACCALAFPCRSEGVGVELGAGLASVFNSDRDAPIAPTLSVRAGYGWNWASVGARGLFILGRSAAVKTATSPVELNPSGFRGLAALADASVYTPGPWSAGIRLAGGMGEVFGLNCNCQDTPIVQGGLSPAFLGSLFGRVLLADHYRASVELAALHFSDLHNDAVGSAPARSGLHAWTALLMLSLEWAQR
jgi:hypothetical protein